jgi:hypothetical protein
MYYECMYVKNKSNKAETVEFQALAVVHCI